MSLKKVKERERDIRGRVNFPNISRLNFSGGDEEVPWGREGNR